MTVDSALADDQHTSVRATLPSDPNSTLIGHSSLGDYSTQGGSPLCATVCLSRDDSTNKTNLRSWFPGASSPAHSTGLWISPDHTGGPAGQGPNRQLAPCSGRQRRRFGVQRARETLRPLPRPDQHERHNMPVLLYGPTEAVRTASLPPDLPRVSSGCHREQPLSASGSVSVCSCVRVIQRLRACACACE